MRTTATVQKFRTNQRDRTRTQSAKRTAQTRRAERQDKRASQRVDIEHDLGAGS